MIEEISVRNIRRIFLPDGFCVEVTVEDTAGWLVFRFLPNGKVQLKAGGGYNEKWQMYKIDKDRIEKLKKKAVDAFINFKLDNLARRRDWE